MPDPSSRKAQRIARRDRRRERSREELLDAAEELLTKAGVAAVTVDAVADEVGLTKAALYYYFGSKEELLFEVVFRHLMAEANAITEAINDADDGAGALRALVRTPIEHYRNKMHIFRLAYMHIQVFSGGRVQAPPELLERIRPMNALIYGRAQALLEQDRDNGLLPDDVAPRRLAFVAHMSALGVLTMKGMVEAEGDPLIHTDEDMIDSLERAFTRACRK